MYGLFVTIEAIRQIRAAAGDDEGPREPGGWAACGVMENFEPYADLDLTLTAGNYGPDSKMQTAVAAYTPNIPWARFGEPDVVDFDGAGTSAATPQAPNRSRAHQNGNWKMPSGDSRSKNGLRRARI